MDESDELRYVWSRIESQEKILGVQILHQSVCLNQRTYVGNVN